MGDFVKKEVKAIQDKLEMVQRFQEKVAKIEAFVTKLNEFDGSIKSMDKWMKDADTQLHDIKNTSDKMTPEDRSHTQWSCKKMLQPRSRLLKQMLHLNLICCHKAKRCPKMLKTTKTNSRGSGTTSWISKRESNKSVT